MTGNTDATLQTHFQDFLLDDSDYPDSNEETDEYEDEAMEQKRMEYNHAKENALANEKAVVNQEKDSDSNYAPFEPDLPDFGKEAFNLPSDIKAALSTSGNEMHHLS